MADLLLVLTGWRPGVKQVHLGDHDPDFERRADRRHTGHGDHKTLCRGWEGYGSFGCGGDGQQVDRKRFDVAGNRRCRKTAAGANATQIKTSGTIAADAVGDWSPGRNAQAEEIQQIGKPLGYNFTHVVARLTLAERR